MHTALVDWPASIPKEPLLHSVHAGMPVVLAYEPAWHGRHVLICTAARVSLYFPMAHWVQTLWPATDWYLPLSQLVQTVLDSVLVYVPVRHPVHISAPDRDMYVPFGQPSHVIFPIASAYVPGEQGMQVAAAWAFSVCDAVPLGHRTAAELPAGQYAPCGHAVPTTFPPLQKVPTEHVCPLEDPDAHCLPGVQDVGVEHPAGQKDPAVHGSMLGALSRSAVQHFCAGHMDWSADFAGHTLPFVHDTAAEYGAGQ